MWWDIIISVAGGYYLIGMIKAYYPTYDAIIWAQENDPEYHKYNPTTAALACLAGILIMALTWPFWEEEKINK